MLEKCSQSVAGRTFGHDWWRVVVPEGGSVGEVGGAGPVGGGGQL